MTNKRFFLLFLIMLYLMPLYSTEIQLAIDEVQPPFSFINTETNKIDGILTQIVTHIFEEIDVDVFSRPA